MTAAAGSRPLEVGEGLPQMSVVERALVADMRSADLVTQIASEHAPGGEHGGDGGYDHTGYLKLPCDLDRVQAGGAAEAEKGEPARVNAAPQRHQPDAICHLEIDQTVHAGGSLGRRQAEPAGKPPYDRIGGGAVEPLAASQEALGIEVAEHEVCVRDVSGSPPPRSRPAQVRRRRSRARPGAYRRCRLCDGPAACADAGDVEAAQGNAVSRQAALG